MTYCGRDVGARALEKGGITLSNFDGTGDADVLFTASVGTESFKISVDG